MDKVDLRQQIQSALSKLHTLRDDIRVRLHLAGMDLNDKWDELELRFEKAERATPHGAPFFVQRITSGRQYSMSLVHVLPPSDGAQPAPSPGRQYPSWRMPAQAQRAKPGLL